MILQSEQDTQKLAQSLSLIIKPPLMIYLTGSLGSGKTFFVRSLLQSLGYKGIAKSPTYSFLETYNTNIGLINHFDLYRFNYEIEWYDLGFDDVVATCSINFIEWAEKISRIELNPDIIISIEPREFIRKFNIQSHSLRGQELVSQWIIK